MELTFRRAPNVMTCAFFIAASHCAAAATSRASHDLEAGLCGMS
jgi:hypothetical protein